MTLTPKSAGYLPISEIIDDVVHAVAHQRRCVVVAPPGAGKTTVVPLALADATDNGTVLMLEPRRLAARAAARRMSDLIGEQVGGVVGYRTRDETVVSDATRIEVITEGILTRRLHNDPSLDGVAVVIFDEVHERHLSTDLGLAFTLESAAVLRTDLAIVAMSATPDTDRLKRLLDDAPVLYSNGRLHTVDTQWRPVPARADIAAATAEVTIEAAHNTDGSLLVFLPGVGEIHRVADRLTPDRLPPGVTVVKLAGAFGSESNDAALSDDGQRRIVLATDIAESSLTVPNVTAVVDSGLCRRPRLDARTGMTRLVTVAISRASADQRAGRAGRTRPGTAYRLWSQIDHGARPAHTDPEISDVDLAGFMLDVHRWGTPLDELRLPTAPPPSSVRAAGELLRSLGAIDNTGSVTDVGRAMAEVPLHPRLARMIVDHPEHTSVALAVLIDDRDPYRGPVEQRPADIAERLAALNSDDPRFDRRAMRRAQDRIVALGRRLGIATSGPVAPQRAGVLLLSAFADRIAMRRNRGRFQAATGTGCWMPADDDLANVEFLVAIDLDGRRDRARIRLAADVSSDDVIEHFASRPEVFSVTERLSWDDDRDDLVRTVERRLGALRLGSRDERAEPGPATVNALLTRVRDTGLAVLGWTSASIDLRRRMAFCHAAMGSPWPSADIASLVANVDDWLAPYLVTASSRHDLESIDPGLLLRALLPWPEGADLDTIAPPRLTLPNGTTLHLNYHDDPPEVTAQVRVQDLFGTTAHPIVAGAPIVLHLLSPADRPMQVTSDLPGFWSGSWEAVRREMRGRYPKHRWPADPAAASPGRLGRDDS